MSQIILYSEVQGTGQSVVIKKDMKNLEDVGFLARAKSLVVFGDPWVVYTGKNYQGKYELYREGTHKTIPRFAGVICSLRMVQGGLANPEITLYETVSYGGEEVPLTQDASSLTLYGLNKKVSSSKVQSGAWQLFQGEEYAGASMVTVAGEELPDYSEFNWNNKVSSAKPYH